jgi:hypothetical protein
VSEQPARVFPPRPIKGVHVRRVKQAACGVFAIATLDFEPAPRGFRLTVGDGLRVDGRGWQPDHQTLAECLAGLAEGVEQELAAHAGLDLRVEVVLREIVIHPVDSNALAFRAAGQLAASTALAQAEQAE